MKKVLTVIRYENNLFSNYNDIQYNYYILYIFLS